jgi:flagellar biosynthetic protein FliP
MKNKLYIVILAIIILITFIKTSAFAEPIPIPQIGIEIGEATSPTETIDNIRLLALLTVLSIAPSILILMTSFTRIIVVFSFLRNALGTQQSPPNQILVGLALFLTFFIMRPIYADVMDNAITPYLNEEITQEAAIEIGSKPIKEFMLKQTREKDLELFIDLSDTDIPTQAIDTGFTVLVPAFVISELKTAFQMGFLIFIPFIIVDMVVASILMSMGMFMLSPVMISLPFKILLFVMVDGWHLVVKSLVESFI